MPLSVSRPLFLGSWLFQVNLVLILVVFAVLVRIFNMIGVAIEILDDLREYLVCDHDTQLGKKHSTQMEKQATKDDYLIWVFCDFEVVEEAAKLRGYLIILIVHGRMELGEVFRVVFPVDFERLHHGVKNCNPADKAPI